jgi:hypothetical protein
MAVIQKSEVSIQKLQINRIERRDLKNGKKKGAHFSRFNRMHMQNLFLILTPDSRFLLIDQEKNFNVKEYRKKAGN